MSFICKIKSIGVLILAIGLGSCSLGHKVFPNFNKSALKEGYLICNIDNFNKNIEVILNGDKTLVYYFDGDCSICISKLLAYENIKVEGFPKIYVSQPADTMLLNFYTDKFAINAPVLVDNKSMFYNTNKELLDIGKQWFLINDKARVLQSGADEDIYLLDK